MNPDQLLLLQTIWDRYGFPTLIIIAIAIGAVGVWRAVWPVIKERIARNDALLDAQAKELRESRLAFEQRLVQHDQVLGTAITDGLNEHTRQLREILLERDRVMMSFVENKTDKLASALEGIRMLLLDRGRGGREK